MRIKNVCVKLVVINLVFFGLQLLFGGLGGWFTKSLLLTGNAFSEPWRLLTHMFLHGSFAHLFFNMYALLMFGGLLEQKIGAKRFLMVYFSAGLIAGIISTPFYTSALGASGAIMGILLSLMVLMPDLKVLLFFMIPMPFWVAGLLWALIDTLGAFFPGGGIGHIAHLAGMIVGLVFGLWFKKTSRRINSSFSNRTHLTAEELESYLGGNR